MEKREEEKDRGQRRRREKDNKYGICTCPAMYYSSLSPVEYGIRHVPRTTGTDVPLTHLRSITAVTCDAMADLTQSTRAHTNTHMNIPPALR